MATIEIGNSSSNCGNCHRPASYREDGHYTNLGWNMEVNGTPGCGEEWTDAVFTYHYTLDVEDYINASHFVPENIKTLLRRHYGLV